MFRNKWAVLLAGTLVMMTLGTIYSWSLFSQVLSAGFGWSSVQVTWAFALAIACVGLGAFAGGYWQDIVGPRAVTLTGVALWGFGNILAGYGTIRFGAGWLYATYGVMGGLGVGLGYITPVAAVTKWFPQQKGMASGVVAMGFGLGAIVYNLVLNHLPAFSAAASAAAVSLRSGGAPLSLAQMTNVMHVFVASGLLFGILGGMGALLLNNPAGARIHEFLNTDDYHFTTQEMLRTPQFYLLWSMLFINVAAGSLAIANAVPMMQELTQATPAAVTGGFAFAAIFNALGRFFWGHISDRVGPRLTFALIYGVQVAVFLTLGKLHELLPVTVAMSVILLCFGGGFGVMPSFNTNYFGTRHVGANYGLLLTAWGAAGLIGPMLAVRMVEITGSLGSVFHFVAIVLLLALALPLMTREPQRKSGIGLLNGLANQAA